MTVISLGGSIVIPKTGFDIEFLKKFRGLILRRVQAGEKFIFVVGGGSTCRQYNEALASTIKVAPIELDWLGIQATKLNAYFVKCLFGKYAYPEVVNIPNKKIKTSKPIIVASGWKPGWSTDYDAVMLAIKHGAKRVINLSNIDYVYTDDPRINPKAEKIVSITWPEFMKKVIKDTTWTAGRNLPFDPIASRLAAKNKLTVTIMRGTNLPEVAKAIANKPCVGTIIK